MKLKILYDACLVGIPSLRESMHGAEFILEAGCNDSNFQTVIKKNNQSQITSSHQ